MDQNMRFGKFHLFMLDLEQAAILHFDVSDKLSLSVRPTMLGPTSAGIHVHFQFR